MQTSVTARLVVMFVIFICLLVPLPFIAALVGERAARQAEVTTEISRTWGAAQTIGGPVLVLPYTYREPTPGGGWREATGRACLLPEVLFVDGTLEPEVRRRSLFDVVVYRARLQVRGQFRRPDLGVLLSPAPDQVFWERAVVSVGVSDPRGLVRQMTLDWNGREVPFVPGAEDVALYDAGVHAAAPVGEAATVVLPFAFMLELNGTGSLQVLPSGNDTRVSLRSPWPHPSFGGAALPETRTVGSAGFEAVWRVPYFGRGFSPSWDAAGGKRAELHERAAAAAFGVSLITPIDIYQQADRAVKYAVLFIVLTLVLAFLWEMTGVALVHPIQYLFVGFVLCVFYLLLLSLAEHVGFAAAYALAAGASVLLLAYYWSWVLHAARRGVAMGTATAVMYGYLYLLLRLEDYALLAGSVGLFAMLAAVMIVTRRVNWYDLRLGAPRPM